MHNYERIVGLTDDMSKRRVLEDLEYHLRQAQRYLHQFDTMLSISRSGAGQDLVAENREELLMGQLNDIAVIYARHFAPASVQVDTRGTKETAA